MNYDTLRIDNDMRLIDMINRFFVNPNIHSSMGCWAELPSPNTISSDQLREFLLDSYEQNKDQKKKYIKFALDSSREMDEIFAVQEQENIWGSMEFMMDSEAEEMVVKFYEKHAEARWFSRKQKKETKQKMDIIEDFLKTYEVLDFLLLVRTLTTRVNYL